MFKSYHLAFFALFFIVTHFNSHAQSSNTKALEEKSPLIGVWESEGEEAPAFLPNEGHKILGLKPGNFDSMIAFFNDPENGYAGPSYFVATSDGKNIYGTIGSTSIPGMEGTEISFGYRYDKAKDKLIVIIDKTEFVMKRISK